jgi:hypothetical protein
MAELTENELDALFTAHALAARECGFVPKPELLPECERLREQGWLERRMLDNGDASYWWTREAEMALDLNAVVASSRGREN